MIDLITTQTILALNLNHFQVKRRETCDWSGVLTSTTKDKKSSYNENPFFSVLLGITSPSSPESN